MVHVVGPRQGKTYASGANAEEVQALSKEVLLFSRFVFSF